MNLYYQETAVFFFTAICLLYAFFEGFSRDKPLNIGITDILFTGWLLLFILKGNRGHISCWIATSLLLMTWAISRIHKRRWLLIILFMALMLHVTSLFWTPQMQPRLHGWSENPGIFANALLPLVCLLAGISLFATQKKYLFLSFGMLLICLPIFFMTGSRAAVLGFTAGIYFMVYLRFCIGGWIKRHLVNGWRKIGVLILLVGIFYLFGYGLYSLRPESVKGRLLMYRICSESLFETPLGHGLVSFQVVYPNHQANFFDKNPQSEYVYYASETKCAFNEFLQTGFELGWAGIALFVLSTMYLLTIKGKKEQEKNIVILKGVFVGLLVTSMFSYPLRNILVGTQCLIFIGILSSYGQRTVFIFQKIKTIRYTILILLIGIYSVTGSYLYKRYKAYRLWNDIYLQAIPDGQITGFYRRAFPVLQNEGLFMYHYGLDLAALEQYDKSDGILLEASKRYNSIELWLCLAENARLRKDYPQAEIYFQKAGRMAPARFIPLFELVKLYRESGQEERMLFYARMIHEKEVKIPSGTIAQIKREVRKILDKNE